MKLTAFIEKGTDGTYGVYLDENELDLLLIGDGNTIEEAIDDFYLCKDEMREYYEGTGKIFPELEFVFQLAEETENTSQSTSKTSPQLEFA